MTCKICGDTDIVTIYDGVIRDGGLGRYTAENKKMWQCKKCKTIWHEPEVQLDEYYESQEYRNSLEGSSEEDDFYRLHDKETLDKFLYTGTTVYRNKVIADIGCGCGGFLDFLKGVAKELIAIEPSSTYREIMKKKGFRTYPYAIDAMKDWLSRVDVITSFDVIEHVEDPKSFLQDSYSLLSEGGIAMIGTPTDAPIMRKLLGKIYEQKVLFSTQHLWIFSEQSLKLMAEEIGYSHIEIKYFQRYGIGNMLGWIREKEPNTSIADTYLTSTLDSVWRKECEDQGLADYIVLYATK